MQSIAVRAEKIIDTLQDDSPSEDIHLQPYLGYSTPDKLIIRGRVLEADTDRASNDTPSLVDDLAAMAALHMTKDVAGETVKLGRYTAQSDENGVYTLELPRKKIRPGWTDAVVTSEQTDGAVHHPVLITSPKAEYGIISNIDDTVIQTKAWTNRKTLWTSVSGSVGSRYVHADAKTLLKVMTKSMSGRKNPVFYVSASPWNLSGFMEAVFTANGVVRGPKFLNDFETTPTVTDNESETRHKAEAIDTILDSNPDLPFYLVGNSAQNDLHVFQDTVKRHQGRIKGVFMRTPSSTLNEEDQRAIDQIRSQGTLVFYGDTFEPLLNHAF